MTTTDPDRLFAELDRQLAEVRAAADDLASRTGVLITGTLVIATLLGARLASANGGLAITALIVLVVATVIGGGVLVPNLKLGPEPTHLSLWFNDTSPRTLNELYAAKILALGANVERLLTMRILFYVQGAAVAVAVGLAIAAIAATAGK